MKVALCMPVYGETKALFTYSLVGMILWSDAHRWVYKDKPAKPIFTRHMMFGLSLIHEARERIATDAIEKGADYLLWLDSDQTFPQETLFKLARQNVPIIGCNYRKRAPHEVISSASKLVDGEPVPIEPQAKGVEIVDQIGFGVCLIKAHVFETLPKPWFGAGALGEDAYFCARAREAGFDIWVDHALSMEVGHIAETVLHF